MLGRAATTTAPPPRGEIGAAGWGGVGSELRASPDARSQPHPSQILILIDAAFSR
jgi:hypothetical protein